MPNIIPTGNIRNYLMYQDKDTLINLVMNYIAKNNISVTSDNTDELARELQSVKNDLEQLQGEYNELEGERDNLEEELANNEMNEVNEVEDAIAFLWDDTEFNSSIEKAITHARNLKLKDNSPIGELLRKLSYKVTIE